MNSPQISFLRFSHQETMAPKRKLCDVCNKTFVDLKIHMRKHTGERPFRCTESECDKAFATSSQLRDHMNVHSGLKPYKCRYCPLAFTQGGNRIRHERDHTGEKPFQCRYCEEAFSHPHLFELHERKHTKERPYVCSYDGCGRTFSQSCNMHSHIREVHKGERPYACDVCEGVAFARNEGLTNHMRLYHNETYVARKKIEETRVSDLLIGAGWTEWHHTELMPPPKHFKREKTIDFRCVDASDTFCRIDFVLGLESGFVFLEVDEHQHRFGYDAALSCDMKRMAKVMSSLVVEAGDAVPRVQWVRYNPNAHHVDGATQAAPKAAREAWLTSYVSALTLTRPLEVCYAYYDVSEGDLEVLQHAEYHAEFKNVARDVTPVCVPCGD